MKNDEYAEVISMFPRIHSEVVASLLKHMPLYMFPNLGMNQIFEERAGEITYLLVELCLKTKRINLDDESAFAWAQVFIAKEIDYKFVDNYVSGFVVRLLYPKKVSNLPK